MRSLRKIFHGWVCKDVLVIGWVDDQAISDDRHRGKGWVCRCVVALDLEVTALCMTSTNINAIHDVSTVVSCSAVEDAEGPGARTVVFIAFTDKALDHPVAFGRYRGG